MKKLMLILFLVLTLSTSVACGADKPSSDEGGSSNVGGDQNGGGITDEENNTGDGLMPNPDSEDAGDVELVSATAVGMDEEIFLSVDSQEGYSYKISYKNDSDNSYTSLDQNLMVSEKGKLKCYIVGIKSGNYKVKIEAECNNSSFSRTISNIAVSERDRSGYAHFGAADGIGAYNSDGTVKEGTKIIYVTNENKNTVTCKINGTTYTGLVKILQAQYNSSTPMLVRIIGKITTNQWTYKNVEPRLSDGSNSTDDFFENTFSDEYGDNLANLIVKFKDQGAGKTYNYTTTVNGLSTVRITNGGTSTTTYKGSDFPDLYGKSVYEDDSYYNMLEVKGSKNITIEGIGADAEIFQFGISFEECNSIEVRNITFTDYPEDALNFLGKDRESLSSFGRFWIHNCTFNRGKNTWDITGEHDKYAGDGSIDFNNVSNVTLSYNRFNNSKKSMLFGSGDSQACMSFTMHHNHFYKVESRLPLGRNVNIHSYNNYFDQCKNGMDVRKNSYIFSENNYFNSTNKPFILSSSKVKSYGDYFASSSSGAATIVTDRTKTVSNNCKPDESTDYSKFDTDENLFYYDSESKKTDVSLMLSAKEIPEYVSANAGTVKYANS